jgi:hypothetical protein
LAIKSNVSINEPRREKYKQEIELLSGGYTDRKAFPGGKITVYPWDSNVDEWFRERIRKGNTDGVVWDIVSQIANLNGADFKKMVIGDVYTILLVSRSIRFQNEVVYTARCPNQLCRHTWKETIKVPDELEKVGTKNQDYPGYDEITLPVSGDTVKIRPLLVEDEIRIHRREEERLAVLFPSERSARLLIPVLEVGGGRPEGDEVMRWYDALSPKDADFLEAEQERLFPHLETRIDHVCDRCEQPFAHDLNFDVNFFRAGGRAVG